MRNGQLIRHKKRREGDKQIIYTPIPTDEFVCTFAFEEHEEGIYQVWSETKEVIIPSDEIAPEEALNIITGGKNA